MLQYCSIRGKKYKMSDTSYLMWYLGIIPFIAITAYYNRILLGIYFSIVFAAAILLTIFGK